MSQPVPMSEVAQAYNQWAQTYETVFNPTRDLAASVVRQQALPMEGREVLEIGCGTGLNTKYLAQASQSVLALDFSTKMLDQARSNVPASNVRFQQQDIRETWPLAENAVDLLVCTLVLEHIEHLEPIFREAARVLRPEGMFFLCELHPFRQYQGGQAQFTPADGKEAVLIPAFLHDVSEYVNTARQTGFKLLHLGEWRDEPDESKVISPRLLSLRLRLRP